MINPDFYIAAAFGLLYHFVNAWIDGYGAARMGTSDRTWHRARWRSRDWWYVPFYGQYIGLPSSLLDVGIILVHIVVIAGLKYWLHLWAYKFGDDYFKKDVYRSRDRGLLRVWQQVGIPIVLYLIYRIIQ